MATTMSLKRVTWSMYMLGFMDLFAVSLFIPLLSNHMKNLGISSTIAGLIGSVYGGVQLFSSPLVGEWSDVRGRKHVLTRCLLATAVGYACSAASYLFILLLLSRFIPGIFKHTQSIAKAYLADITPKRDQASVFGWCNSVSSAGFIVGPVVGGHLAEMPGGFYLICTISSSIFILMWLFVMFFIPDSHKLIMSRSKSQKLLEQALEKGTRTSPFSIFSQIKWSEQWDLLGARFLMGLAVMVYRFNFSIVLEERYSSKPSTIGYVISYSGIVATISGALVGHICSLYRHNYNRLYAHMSLLQVVALITITFAPTFTLLILTLAPLSISNAIQRVCMTKLSIMRSGHNTEVGSLLGIGASVSSLARVVSPTVGGIAAEVSLSGPGVASVMVAGSGAMLFSAASYYRSTLPPPSQEQNGIDTKESKKEL